MKSNSIPEILDIMAVCIAVVIVCPIAIVVFDSTPGIFLARMFVLLSILSLAICVGISGFVRGALDTIVERAIVIFPTISLSMLLGTLLLFLLVIVLFIMFFAIWLSNESEHLLTFGACFLFTYVICSVVFSWD